MGERRPQLTRKQVTLCYLQSMTANHLLDWGGITILQAHEAAMYALRLLRTAGLPLKPSWAALAQHPETLEQLRVDAQGRGVNWEPDPIADADLPK